jgi:hypothetical protein
LRSRPASALALGAAVVVLLALAAVAARHAHPAEVSPVLPRGAWNDLWIGAIVAAFVAYLVALGMARPALVVAVCVAVAAQAVVFLSPLILSKDVYLYWNESRVVAVHHASPYRTTPDTFQRDPSLPYVSEEWRTTGAPYGPTWEALSVVPGSVGGSSASAAAWAFRVFGSLGILLTIAIVAVRTRSGAEVALLGWNPLIALHFAGGGHNDGWLLALLASAVLARPQAARGLAWPLALAFKPLALVLLPLEAVAHGLRRPRAFWLGAAAGVAVVLGLSAWWGFGWVHTALVGIHGTAPLGGVHWLSQAGLRHRYAVAIAALVFAVVYVALLLRARRDGRARFSLASSALCLTSSLLRPWYGAWPLALAAVEEDGAGALVAVLLSIYLVLGDAVQF